MSGFDTSGCSNSITLGGVLLTDDWVMVENLEVLLEGSDIRGSDRIIPNGAGSRAKPRRTTITQKSLQVTITGEAAYDGGTVTDIKAQLNTNLAYFRHQCVDPDDQGGLNLNADGTRDAVLALAGVTLAEDTVTAHTGPLRLARFADSLLLATLTLSFPQGCWVLA